MANGHAGAVTPPVILRHKDATRQALLYGIFALVAVSPVVTSFVIQGPGRWWSLLLLPVVAFAAYSSIRLATLRVRLDQTGVWEPNPFRLTYVTPWDDVRRAERALTQGRVRFVGVRLIHADGVGHDILALKVQAAAAYSEPTVEGWVDAINEARRAS